MNSSNPRRSQQYGWVIVGATAVCMGVAIGSLSSLSIYLKPISADLGWQRGATSFAYLAGTFSLGLFSIPMGFLADRFSVRLIALSGSVLLGVCYLALSGLDSLWEFYLYYCLMGAFGSAALFSPLLAQVGQWFQAQSGAALGMCTAAFALAQSAMPSLAGYLISVMGWRGAYTAIGWGCLIVLVPLTLLFRPAPAQTQAVAAAPGETAGFPPATPPWSAQIGASSGPNGVVMISLAVVFCCICHATLLIHLVPLSQDMGIGPRQAAGLLTTVFIGGLFGRIVVGFLSDRIGGLKSYLLFSLGQTIPIYIFLFLDSLPAFYFFTAVFGFFFGGVMTAIFTSLEAYVTPENRGMSFGLVSFFGWMGMGVGGYQGGYFYDLRGDYHLSFQIAVAAGALNLLILSMLYLRGRPLLQPIVPTTA